MAKKILNQVEKTSEPKVTLSCGISSWSSENRQSVSELFIQADQALYIAKKEGKNQIVIESQQVV